MSDDGLGILIPPSRLLRIRGAQGDLDVEISPLTIARLGPFARALRPLGGVLAVQEIDLLSLSEHAEALMDAVIAATGLDADQVRSLRADQFASLAGAVAEINADFFVHCLVPTLNRVAVQVRQAMTGSTSASGSSAPGIDGPTS